MTSAVKRSALARRRGEGRAVVLVDATSLTPKMKGVGRYAWQLCFALDQHLPKDVRLVLVVFEGKLPAFPAGFRAEWIRIPYRSEAQLGLLEFPRLIRSTQADVFVRPADKIGWKFSIPTLTVCHDVNPLIWAVQPPVSWRRKMLNGVWERLRGHALRKSDLVLCNSKFIQSAAVGHFGLAQERTAVAYCGVDRRIPELAADVDVSSLLRNLGVEQFVLAFATGDEREGFRILPQLWAAARKGGYPGMLVIAGVREAAAYARELDAAFCSASQKDGFRFLPFLGPEQIGLLAGLYRAADFYLETSRHEGFGMQLVEAMACGTTCFSSGRGALAEVGGGFPLPLDIDDPEAAGLAVAGAWRDGLHQRDNREQTAHALAFDWREVATLTVDFVLQNLPSNA